MARITPIRISQNDRKEYARLVRNARAKINRTRKSHNIDLSDAVDLPKISDFSTRKQFNEWKEQAESFTNRSNLRYQFVTNPYGVTASKSEILQMQTNRRIAINKAKEELKKVEDRRVMQGGKDVGSVKDQTLHFSVPSVTGVTIPKKFNFDEIRNDRRLKEVKEVDERRSQEGHWDWRKEQMKMNFMKGLEESFDSYADDLVDRLAQMPPDVFFEMYVDNAEFDFDDFFYKDGEFLMVEANHHVNKLSAILEKYEGGKYTNPDLKDF